jgi:AbrB family looped-hinge helix DNA binding protein
MKQKGQVTIPQELRTEFGLEEGVFMDIDKKDGKIVITPLPPLEPGEPVGEEEFKKIIAELDESRRNWR